MIANIFVTTPHTGRAVHKKFVWMEYQWMKNIWQFCYKLSIKGALVVEGMGGRGGQNGACGWGDNLMDPEGLECMDPKVWSVFPARKIWKVCQRIDLLAYFQFFFP